MSYQDSACGVLVALGGNVSKEALFVVWVLKTYYSSRKYTGNMRQIDGWALCIQE
jgi:hypothetical protein